MYKKIIIFGFPHSGTTILRNIISHIESVYEISDEISNINDNDNDYTNYNFVLCKYPYLIKESELLTLYSDYIKIFIIRNPLYVFSSLNKRFEYQSLDCNHSIDKYIDTIKEFNKLKEKNINQLFLIRYEDMFEDNYKSLKYIFNKIGFHYDDGVFDNSKHTNKVQFGNHLTIPQTRPSERCHHEYRLFQINQRFENNNDKNNISLTESQCQILTTDTSILEAYPENKILI
jgi:hypothetical protein